MWRPSLETPERRIFFARCECRLAVDDLAAVGVEDLPEM